jgi:hypothetical protein
MGGETMTCAERIHAAISLEKPDRTPIVPLWSTAAAAVLADFDPVTAGTLDAAGRQDLELKVFDEYGGWDGQAGTIPATPERWVLLGMTAAPATFERPQEQVIERENMILDDYELVAKLGWNRFVAEHLYSRITGVDGGAERLNADRTSVMQRGLAEYRRRGASVVFASWSYHPFFTFSLARSLVRFVADIQYQPELVERAVEKCTEELIEANIKVAKACEVPCACLVEERASAYFFPLSVFERFWWPATKKIVDALWSEGIVTWLHLDTPWDRNLVYFRDLPRGSAILDFDGTTDVFAAKEVLRNHLCIASGVHPALLSLGKPEEVETYCKKLIDEVGRDGGHILSTGCMVPAAIRPENFKAFLHTGKTYELSRH